MKTRTISARCSPPNQATTPIRELLEGPALLTGLWPDERSRPSLRWLRTQQELGTIPVVRCGRRALFCPAQVRDAIQQRFTVMPKAWVRGGRTAWDLPALGTLTDGVGLLGWLNDEFGLRRSLRWLRDQQRARSVPFVKLGAKVCFCAEQVRFVLESGAVGDGLYRKIRNQTRVQQTDRQKRDGRLVTIRVPWALCGAKCQVFSDLSYWTALK